MEYIKLGNTGLDVSRVCLAVSEGAVASLPVILTADEMGFLEEPYVPHKVGGAI